jgi:hypothetical protein
MMQVEPTNADFFRKLRRELFMLAPPPIEWSVVHAF